MKKQTQTLAQRVQCLEAIQRVQAGNMDAAHEEARELAHIVDTVHAMAMAVQTYTYALARRLTVLEAEVGDNGKYWRGLAMEHERRLDELQRPSRGRRLWVWLTDDLWGR